MLKHSLICLALGAAVFQSVPVSAGPAPAGYIMSVELQGADATARTVILRDGKELVAKLMMPIYADDVIFLRDAKSSIEIEVEGGTEHQITGPNARFKVTGEVATGDDTWSLISAVANVIDDEEGEAIPDNMAARGDEDTLKIPMAVHGANSLADSTRRLWLAWSGGKGPYTVEIEAGGKVVKYEGIAAQELEFDTPEASVKRFTVTVTDAGGRTATVAMRYRGELPALDDATAKKLPAGGAQELVYASWLTGLKEGDWTVAAAQILHQKAEFDGAARSLLGKIVEGWKYKG